MAEIKLNFLHPTDGRILTVDVDDTMTALEAIGELLGANFIPSNPDGYKLAIKGGGDILSNQSFGNAGAQAGATIRVLPQTDAGFRVFYPHFLEN